MPRTAISKHEPDRVGSDGSMTHAISGIAEDVAAKLVKLGVRSWFDLVLHLPLRYEDETRIIPLRDAQSGRSVQIEARVIDAEIRYRPKRQLVVRVEDHGADLLLRFLNFYPSQVKQFAPGKRVRLFGEVRPGFFGDEMVHPRYRMVQKGAALPKSLTPVNP